MIVRMIIDNIDNMPARLIWPIHQEDAREFANKQKATRQLCSCRTAALRECSA